jgi:hypothetical protein
VARGVNCDLLLGLTEDYLGFNRSHVTSEKEIFIDLYLIIVIVVMVYVTCLVNDK